MYLHRFSFLLFTEIRFKKYEAQGGHVGGAEGGDLSQKVIRDQLKLGFGDELVSNFQGQTGVD